METCSRDAQDYRWSSYNRILQSLEATFSRMHKPQRSRFLRFCPPNCSNKFLRGFASILCLLLFQRGSRIHFTSWKSTPTYEIDENKYPAARWLIGLNYPHKTDLEQDLNGDGVELVTAYALYLNPRENLSSDVLKPQFTAESTSFIFKPVRTGFTYTVMYSNDLSNWSSDGVTYEFIPIDGFRAVIRNPSFPQFFCIEVTQD